MIRRPAFLLVLTVAACAPRDSSDRPADTAASTPRDTTAARPRDTAVAAPTTGVRVHRERQVDLARDGHPFTILVDAAGPTADSMQVRLRIVRGDTVHHRADWTTTLYGRYDVHPVSADSARRRALARLDALLSDAAFAPTSTFLGAERDRDRVLAEAIGFDVAVDAARAQRGLAPADSLPADVAQSPPPSTDSTRIRALVAELRDVPAFRYHAGGEATYAVAWSAHEHRFVTVDGCC